jgi:hypothetical protein
MAVVNQSNLSGQGNNPTGPSHEEVVELKRQQGLAGGAVTDEPKPDMPFTRAAAGYGDPGHVNPAINPAPIWEKQKRPPPVPVINDPGVLGSAPKLADLNRAAINSDRAAAGANPMPEGKAMDANVVTQDTIREAATARLERLTAPPEDEAKPDKPRRQADKPSTRGAKSGRAATRSKK